MLPKTSAFVKVYDGQTKWMYLLIEDIILSGIKSALISKKNLISSLYIITLFWKLKKKSHGDEVKDFYDKKIPKLDSSHTCLALITLPLNYQQVFLKECKYIENKVIRHINDNLSDFSSSDESDEEYIKAIRLIIF